VGANLKDSAEGLPILILFFLCEQKKRRIMVCHFILLSGFNDYF